MADGGPADRPVGTVAEEAARLLDALLAQDWATPATPATPATGATGATDTAPADADEFVDVDEGGSDSAAGPCPACGHVQEDGGHHRLDIAAPDDPVCRLCPVCQLVRVARTVRPETMERLADLASAVADTLREVALAGMAQRQPARPRRTVQDIPVDSSDDVPDDMSDEPSDDDAAEDYPGPGEDR